MTKVLCVAKFWSGRYLDLVLHRHDFDPQHKATPLVADTHRNSLHGHHNLIAKDLLEWYGTLVEVARRTGK